MPNWLSDISSKFGNFIGSRPPSAHFGAFGKHPAWDDHIPDLGLDSEPLIATARYLYRKAISDVIDQGLWDKLPSGEALAEFNHVFVWLDERETLVGKLWSSSDGKGRTKFPMVVCGHFSNRAEPGLPDVGPDLSQLEKSCRAATSEEDVRQLIADARKSAAILLRAPAEKETPRTEIAQSLGLEPSSEAVARIAYSARSHFSPLRETGIAKARINLKLETILSLPQHIRVPAVPDKPFASQHFWQQFLSDVIPVGAPQLYIAPVAFPWLDIIVGPLTAKHLFCLRADEKAMPLASQIPFTLTDEFRSQAASRWQSFLAGN